jgi:uncharacterized protein
VNDVTDSPDSGVKIRLVSHQLLDPMPTSEKIRFILDEVEAGKVLVLERGLQPLEEAELIAATMAQIQPDGFTGIEMQSSDPQAGGRLARLLQIGRRSQSRMMVIGPANRVKNVHKDPHSIQALIVAAGA